MVDRFVKDEPSRHCLDALLHRDGVGVINILFVAENTADMEGRIQLRVVDLRRENDIRIVHTDIADDIRRLRRAHVYVGTGDILPEGCHYYSKPIPVYKRGSAIVEVKVHTVVVACRVYCHYSGVRVRKMRIDLGVRESGNEIEIACKDNAASAEAARIHLRRPAAVHGPEADAVGKGIAV